MKKVLLSILAVAAMASCVQSEDVNPQQLIDFGSPFVGGTTKAIDYSYGANKLLNEIYVYGSLKGTTANYISVFDHEKVWTDAADGDYTKEWKCNATKYWVPGADYKFVALAGVDKANVTATDAIPSSLAFISEGTTDLVAGYVEKNNVSATGNGIVSFNMGHLLSKVKFTITNITNEGDDTKNSGFYYKVTDIKLTNAATSGTCALTYVAPDTTTPSGVTGTWTTTLGEVNFGHATDADATAVVAEANTIQIADRVKATSNHEYLVVPYTYTSTETLKVSFDLALYASDDTLVNEKETKSTEVVVDFVAGYAYNFKINLSLNEPIKFTVSSNPGWKEAGEETVNFETTL